MSSKPLERACVVLCGAALATLLPASAQDETPEQRRIRLIKQNGYTYENCFMKARPITISGVQSEIPNHFPPAHFPYKWNFNDGTPCGAYATGGARDLQVEGGILRFVTSGEGSYVNWGAMVPSKPPLSFGYPDMEGYKSPQFAGVTLRMRQSLPESTWWVNVLAMHRNTPRPRKTKVVTLKGTDWQEIKILSPLLNGPWPGLQLCTDRPGNRIEIDRVTPICDGQLVPMRKVLDLPAEVEWAKCSLSTKVEGATVYVNGKDVVKTDPGTTGKVLWNYEIDPRVFRKGVNVIVIETRQTCGTATILLDAALLCKDGTYVRFDSDESWKRPVKVLRGNVEMWRTPDFDDSIWVGTQIFRKVLQKKPVHRWVDADDEMWFYNSISVGGRFFFNPSWKGRIAASPADGRKQPVFSTSENVAIRVSVPFRSGADQQVVYALADEMGDDLVPKDRLVTEGAVALKRQGIYNVGELRLPPKTIAANTAYALDLTLRESGQDIETYRYEMAVCGPLDLPEIENPKDYTDGMDLKLVWHRDAAAEQAAGEFISCLGNAREAPAPVIETPLGKFRTTNPDKVTKTRGGSYANFMSFTYTIENPGRPHVVLAEYPDDTLRFQEMRVSDGFSAGNAISIGNDSVAIGTPTPPSHTIKHHHALVFPNDTSGTITFFGMGNKDYYKPSQAARVGKMWIYEILNDVPARKIKDAPGKKRWFGQHPEAGPRQIVTSCFTGPAASYFKGFCMLANNSPYFYRNWMITYRNMVRRLRFAGENAYFSGQMMYGGALFPTRYSNDSAYDYGRSPGEMRDAGVLMSRVFEENGMGWFSSLQLTKLPTIRKTCSDEAVAEGWDTLGVVTRDGKQVQGFRGITPNWLRPECQKVFRTIIDELIALYSRERGWKGIKLYLNSANGPCWPSWEDPLMSSYDDYTIGVFEKETGTKIPVDAKDRARFQKRHAWINGNAMEQWVRWRADKMNDIYRWVRDRLTAARPDLELILFAQFHKINPDLSRPVTSTAQQRALAIGFDLEGLKKESSIIIAGCPPSMPGAIDSHLAGKDEFAKKQAVVLDDAYLSSLSNDGKNGISFRCGWYEPQPNTPDGWVWPKGSHQLMGLAWAYSRGASLAENWVNIFIRSNPTLIVHSMQDLHMWNGREHYTGRFAEAFRSIPSTRYKRLTGNGLDKNLWVAVGAYERNTYGYVANPFWWQTDATLAVRGGLRIEDLITGSETGSSEWRLDLGPYEVRTFKVAGAPPAAILKSAQAKPEGKAIAHIRAMLDENRDSVESQGDVISRCPGLGEGLREWLGDCETLLKEGRFGTAYNALAVSRYSPKAKQLAWKLEGYEPLLAQFPRSEAPLKMDGEFSDWEAIKPVLAINRKERLLLQRGADYQGAADLSGKGYGAWDETHLYLAFDVMDDDLQPATFSADSVELYFDMDIYSDFGHGSYTHDDLNFKFAPVLTTSETSMDIRRGKDGAKVYIPDNGNVRAAWQKAPAGYKIEVSIPWETLAADTPATQGMTFGFDAMIIDKDKNKDPNPLRVMFWSSPKTPFQDPRTFGRAVLAGR